MMIHTHIYTCVCIIFFFLTSKEEEKESVLEKNIY